MMQCHNRPVCLSRYLSLSKSSALIRRQIFTLCAVLCLTALACGEEAPGSHQVNANGSITFRYQDPAAATVLLHLDGLSKPLSMEKSGNGDWAITTSPLPPEIYGYTFEVDGQYRLDPRNTANSPNLLYLSSLVEVAGSTPQLWGAQDVPHGEVRHHFYTSAVVQGLKDGQSEFFVYTPPGYDPKRAKPYPTLYLLHGWSDKANGWIEVGRANFVFDNLIAAGKMQPMLVIMPLGYGDMKFVLDGEKQWDDDTTVNRNVTLFAQALLTEILPRVESAYRASTDRNDRAIAGLSMGGLESLTIGLTHSQQFGWVGGFSSALGHGEQKSLATLTAKGLDFNILWIACGTDEELLDPNRQFISWLKAKQIPLTAYETPGMHTWQVWRNDLEHFAPLLFQPR